MVTRKVDKAQPQRQAAVSFCFKRSEAEVNRDPAALLVRQAVGIDPGERAGPVWSFRDRYGPLCRSRWTATGLSRVKACAYTVSTFDRRPHRNATALEKGRQRRIAVCVHGTQIQQHFVFADSSNHWRIRLAEGGEQFICGQCCVTQRQRVTR